LGLVQSSHPHIVGFIDAAAGWAHGVFELAGFVFDFAHTGRTGGAVDMDVENAQKNANSHRFMGESRVVFHNFYIRNGAICRREHCFWVNRDDAIGITKKR
jgi:hypothetical protein